MLKALCKNHKGLVISFKDDVVLNSSHKQERLFNIENKCSFLRYTRFLDALYVIVELSFKIY